MPLVGSSTHVPPSSREGPIYEISANLKYLQNYLQYALPHSFYPSSHFISTFYKCSRWLAVWIRLLHSLAKNPSKPTSQQHQHLLAKRYPFSSLPYQLHFQLSDIYSTTFPPTLPMQLCSIVPTLAEASSKPPLQTILAATKNLLSTSHPGEPRGFPLTLPPASTRMAI